MMHDDRPLPANPSFLSNRRTIWADTVTVPRHASGSHGESCSPESHPSVTLPVKSEPHDRDKGFRMDTEDFPAQLPAPAAEAAPSSAAAADREGPRLRAPGGGLALATDNLKRVPSAGSSSVACRRWRPTTPRPHSYSRATCLWRKCCRSPDWEPSWGSTGSLPLPTTSAGKAAPERNVAEMPSARPIQMGRATWPEPWHRSKWGSEENHPKKRVARTEGGTRKWNVSQGNCWWTRTWKGCPVSSAPAWVRWHTANLWSRSGWTSTLRRAGLLTALRSNAQKRLLPSCSFQQTLFHADKNGASSRPRPRTDSSFTKCLWHPGAPLLQQLCYRPLPRAQQAVMRSPSTGTLNRRDWGRLAFSAPHQLRLANMAPPTCLNKEGDDAGGPRTECLTRPWHLPPAPPARLAPASPASPRHLRLPPPHPNLWSSTLEQKQQPPVTMETTKRLQLATVHGHM